MKRSRFLAVRVLTLTAALAVMCISGPARGAAKDVDLNSDGTPESTVSLTVVTTSPVKVQNKITNKAPGTTFRFSWLSAGPGGFSSSLAPGSIAGVGAIWTWQTTRQVYSFTGSTCTNDICLNRTTPADNRQFGPFGVPGRSLTTSGVTTTSESLTSTLVTFFSPPTELFSITSSVDQIAPGVFRYKEVYQNNTGQPITVNQSSGPYGCDTNCGNGIREGNEVCDGSDLGGASCLQYNATGTLGCSADCRSYDVSGCVPAVCGNGVHEASEQCDGTDLNGQSCESYGGSGGPLHCNGDCTVDVHDCTGVCRNGVREGDEQCDGSDFGGETCQSQGGGGSGGFTYSSFGPSDACFPHTGCLINANGDAATAIDDANRHVLRLTPATGGQSGSAWYDAPQPVAGGFTTTFTFRLSDPSVPPADGIAFVVQNYTYDAVSGTGQTMGYEFPNSVAVEFDTYTNADGYDPNANHVAVQSCGTGVNYPFHPPHPNSCTQGGVNDELPVTLSDGNVHTATVTYDPAGGGTTLGDGFKGLLTVTLDGSLVQEVPFDMSYIGLGGDSYDHAWVGFTSATGAAFENHDILSWTFTPTVPDSSGSLNCNDSCQIDVTQCSDICGNGVIDPGEECDRYNVGEHSCADQDGVGNVSCSNDCHLQYSCTTEYCGNGVRDGEEACDGSDLGDYDCEALGGGGGTLGCDYNCNFDVSQCTNLCGNGVREGDEACDGSDFGSASCTDYGGNPVDGHLTCVGCTIDASTCDPEPPDCDVNATSNLVPPAEDSSPGRVEICEISPHPAKEVTTKVDVCGSAIPDGPDSCGTEPATSGTANVFVPDLDKTIGSVYFTTKGIQVSDPDGDGLPKPGHTVSIFIPLMNVGFGTATNVSAVLSSPAYDIDGDGVDDPVTISQAQSPYPGPPCFVGHTPGPGDCNSPPAEPLACTNLIPFVVTFPAGHPADISRKFVLTISYNEQGALGGLPTFLTPVVLGVAGGPVDRCGDSVVTPGEQCDDGNNVDGDCCSSTCQYETEGSPCTPDDNDLCTTEACNASGVCTHQDISSSCDDGNPCTADSCSAASGCLHESVGGSCDDGNPCTVVDSCSNGQCVGTGSLSCNDGNLCTNDSCVPGVGCTYVNNNTCGANPKGQGYWKRICAGPHPSGEFISPVDVACVNDACTFGSVQSVADLCDRMNPNPQNDKCEKAEAHFMTLLLNVCRGRVGRYEATQSGCGDNTNVDEAIRDADALLCSSSRTHETCVNAQCETEEINNGKALGVTSLRVTRNGTSMKLNWGPPYTDSESLAPIKYRVWRRINSNVNFTQLLETTALSFTDNNANGTAYQYEVTVVW